MEELRGEAHGYESPWVRKPIVCCHIVLNYNRLSLVGKIIWKTLCACFAVQDFRRVIFGKRSVNCASKYCLYFSRNENTPVAAQCKATLSPATRHCDRGFETQTSHGRMSAFSLCAVQRRDLPKGYASVQDVQSNVYKIQNFRNWNRPSDLTQVDEKKYCDKWNVKTTDIFIVANCNERHFIALA